MTERGQLVRRYWAGMMRRFAMLAVCSLAALLLGPIAGVAVSARTVAACCCPPDPQPTFCPPTNPNIVFVHDRVTNTSEQVTVGLDGAIPNGASQGPLTLSADGRFVAFGSMASNLVTGDTNGTSDIFVRDRQTSQTFRISVASDGTQSNGSSQAPSMSADGRFIAFASDATTLVSGDTNGMTDVFVHDRHSRQTRRVSVTTDGTQGDGRSWSPAMSASGRFIAFSSASTNLVPGDTNGTEDVFVHDLITGQTSRVSVAGTGKQAIGHSGTPAISATGRFVAFVSQATNLVSGDTNGHQDVFVHDRDTGRTVRVSTASGGTQANGEAHRPAISATGRFIAFESTATNLAPNAMLATAVYVHDLWSRETTVMSVALDGTVGPATSGNASISADGQLVAFDSSASNLVPDDTNGLREVFVRDRAAGQTSRLILSMEPSTEARISANGRVVAFVSKVHVPSPFNP